LLLRPEVERLHELRSVLVLKTHVVAHEVHRVGGAFCHLLLAQRLRRHAPPPFLRRRVSSRPSASSFLSSAPSFSLRAGAAAAPRAPPRLSPAESHTNAAALVSPARALAICVRNTASYASTGRPRASASCRALSSRSPSFAPGGASIVSSSSSMSLRGRFFTARRFIPRPPTASRRAPARGGAASGGWNNTSFPRWPRTSCRRCTAIPADTAAPRSPPSAPPAAPPAAHT